MYYEVLVKCGHVGKNKYLLKNLYITADSGKEAAGIARNVPRVKHDYKDAILNVTKVSKEKFYQGIENNNNDLYFLTSNVQEQRIYNAVNYEDVIDIELDCTKRTRNIEYKLKKQKIYLEDAKYQMTNLAYM